MNIFTRYWQREINHFNTLSASAQKLLYSIFFYNITGPIAGIFTNAFLLRQTQDFNLVALFNLCLFLAVPFGFYLNGILMKKFMPSSLYFLGLICEGITIASILFISQITSSTIIIFGLIYGLSVGIYWANRNLLTLKTTESNNRIYFSSIETNSNTIANIFIPILLGWFIALGGTTHLYSPQLGYKVLAIFMLLILIIVGFIIMNLSVKIPHSPSLWLKSASPQWKKFRWYELIVGFMGGSSLFLPVLMIFTFIGKEGSLGLIQSGAALLSALIIYLLTKSISIHHRLLVLTISVVLAIVGATAFSLLYSSVGVIIFLICTALATPLLWIALNSLNYDLIDEENKNSEKHYAYVCDQEIYLNLGRVLAIGFFILLIQLFSNNTALRFAPLVLAASEIFLFFIAKSIEKNYTKPS